VTTERPSVLAFVLHRAGLAYATAAVAGGRDPEKRASVKELWRATIKSTATATRVTALIVMWATALRDKDRESLGIEEYVEWSTDSRTASHRYLAEFRRVFPEWNDPNVIALDVLRASPDRDPAPSTLLPV
jgi:hypothetical protein